MKNFSPVEIAAWCAGRWETGVPDAVIKGFSKDSRTVGPGECYVALRGEVYDGHEFVRAAAAKGASCAVVDADFTGQVTLPILRVGDTTAALQAIASGYRRKLDPFVIGVTGSSGKTTVKEMIAACLATQFRTASTFGNLNNHIGLPMSLLGMEGDTECAVMEIGMNHPGEVGTLCSILEPDWGVVTNVGPVHLEFFDSVEAIAREKAVLLARSKSKVFLDADSRYFGILSSAAQCTAVTVSQKGSADYVYKTGSSLVVEETGSGESCEVELQIPGEHIAYDAALSAAVARCRGIGWLDISKALSSYRPLPMRWEVHRLSGVTLINDAYNANPMSMRASIKAFLSQPVEGKRIVVLGDMLELGASSVDEHGSLGRWLKDAGIEHLVTVGQLSHETAGEAAGKFDVSEVEKAEDVARVLRGRVGPGDAVLFKASRGIHLETAVLQMSEYLSGVRVNNKQRGKHECTRSGE